MRHKYGKILDTIFAFLRETARVIQYIDVERTACTNSLPKKRFRNTKPLSSPTPKGNFAQSYLWGKQKPMWQWDAIAVRGEDGAIRGSLAVMTRKGPRYRQNSHVRLPRSGVRFR